MSIDLIIFDWSGVVSDDSNTVVYALNAAFSQQGLPGVDLRTFCDNYGNIEGVLGEKYGVAIPVKEFWNLYQHFIKTSPVRPVMITGVDNVLPQVNHNRKLVVFSSHPQECLDEESSRYRIRQYFHLLEGGVVDKNKRIGGFLNELGVNRDNVVYVGDTVVDVEAARKAGVRFVGVLTGYHGSRFYGSSKFLEAGVPKENIIKALDELPALLERV